VHDAIISSQEHSGTPLGMAVKSIYAERAFKQKSIVYSGLTYPIDYSGQDLHPDRLIVITDEQSRDPVPDPLGVGYMINVASFKNGIGYGAWHHIDGWSEAVIDYIKAYEADIINANAGQDET